MRRRSGVGRDERSSRGRLRAVPWAAEGGLRRRVQAGVADADGVASLVGKRELAVRPSLLLLVEEVMDGVRRLLDQHGHQGGDRHQPADATELTADDSRSPHGAGMLPEQTTNFHAGQGAGRNLQKESRRLDEAELAGRAMQDAAQLGTVRLFPAPSCAGSAHARISDRRR